MRLLMVAAVLAGGTWAASQEKPGSPEALVRDFKEAYARAGKDEAARAAAVRTLGTLPHPKTLSVLQKLVQGDESGRETLAVRTAAAETLASFKEVRGASQVLAAAARNRDRKLVPLRQASVRSLGDLGAADALDTLHKILWEKPFELARDSVDALGKIRHKSSVPQLIKLLREAEQVPDAGLDEVFIELPIGGLGAGGAVLDDARNEMRARNRILHQPVLKTLKDLTGQDLPRHKDWQKWWQKEGSRFQVPGSSK